MVANVALSNQIAVAYSASSPSYTPSLGTNLGALSYYSTALSNLDLIKSASQWLPQNIYTFNTYEPLNLDANGWVTAIPAAGGSAYDRVGITLLGNNAAAPANAHYVVLYQGEGDIEGSLGTTVIESSSTPGHLVIQAASDGSLNLQLLSTDPNHTGDYLRDIQVVLESDLPLFEAGLNFNPDFLNKVEDFHTLRFMDWMSTNQVFDKSGTSIGYDAQVGFGNVANVGLIDWADRPKMTDAQWDHGVPVEALVQAANAAGTDVWFNMPINASDDYVRGFATYVRDNLRPDLKIHVEFSNEVWNSNFPQFQYALAQAKAEFGGTGFGDNGNFFEWYGIRAAQVGIVWKDVFGQPATSHDSSNRVSLVLNTQLSNMGVEEFALDSRDWVDANGNHLRAADYFDEYAVAGYYGDVLSSDANLATVRSWLTQPDGGFTSAIAAMKEQIENYNTPFYEYHAAQASAYGLKLVAYEAGYGAVASVATNNDTSITDFYTALARDPRTYALEQENYAAFENAGGTLYNNFEAIAASSKHGSYGVLESVTQDTSPRYQALVDLNASVTPLFGAGQTAATFQNARFYEAGDGGEVIAGTVHGYDVLAGGAGNDVFVLYGTGSNVDGGTGFDTVVLPGTISDYTLVQQADGSTLVKGNGESWTLRDIDRIVANDGTVLSIGTGPVGVMVTSVVASGTGITAGAGDLGVGAVVKLTVNLSGAVTVSGGVPTLDLNDGGVATYVSGSGTSALTFAYTVAKNENTADLAVTAIHLNNASIVTNLPTTALGAGPTPNLNGAVTNPDGILQIDTVVTPLVPVVTSVVVSGPGITAGAGNLGVGAVVTLTLNMSSAVNVSGGVPTLDLNDGGVATYTSGSGSNALQFTYTVASGQSTSDLTVTGFHLNDAIVRANAAIITSTGGGSLTDVNGHVFSFGAVYQGTDHYILRDGLPDGAGSTLVLVEGVIYNYNSLYGWYADRNGSFVYEPNPPALDQGHAADLSSAVVNPAGVLQINTTSTPPTDPGTPSGPVVTSVTASGAGITAGAGTLSVGAVVTLTLNMSAAVNVSGGVPTLDLIDGGVATYAGGSGSNALKFTYTVAAGQNTADLTVIGFHLNNATVTTGTPTLSSDSSGSLTDANGHVFSFGAVYQGTDHYILRDGLPDGAGSMLALVNGVIYNHTASYGWYADHNGSFVYEPNPPTLTSGPAADLSAALVNPAGILKVDTTSQPTIPVTPSGPVVTSVVASGAGITAGAGTLAAGAVVTLTLNMSAAVNVSGGVPTLDLNDGGTATYAGGSGSNALKFTYTVAAGQNTADLTVTGFHLNNATVTTGTPTLSSDSSGSLTDANGHVFSFGAAYQGTDHFILRDGLPDGAGTTLVLVNGVIYNHTASYGWYSDHNGSFVYEANPPTIASGLAASLSAAVVNPAGILKIDTTSQPPVPVTPSGPVVTSVVASGAGITAGAGDLGVGAVVTLTVNMSSAVSVSGGVPTLDLNDGGVAIYAGGSGSNALKFTYTVAAGQNTADLTVTGFHLNNATVTTGTPTLSSDSSGSLTDANGHVFSFGAVYQGTDHFILRDGLQEGAGSTLALVNGVIYNHTASYGWYSDHNGSFVYETSPPTLDSGHSADLSAAVANPAGILQIDTTSQPAVPATPSGPVVTSVVASGDGITAGAGTLGVGAVVTLTLNMSAAVNISGGVPTLDLNDGGVATYASGSGSNALKFTYTVASGQNTADLTVTAFHSNNATVTTGTPTIMSDGSGSLTDANGHVFSFGAAYQGTDHFILRDGLTNGAGTTLALVNGTIYNHTASYGWYADHNGSFAYEPNPPAIDQGHAADLGAAVTNPAGILHIDTSAASSALWHI